MCLFELDVVKGGDVGTVDGFEGSVNSGVREIGNFSGQYLLSAAVFFEVIIVVEISDGADGLVQVFLVYSAAIFFSEGHVLFGGVERKMASDVVDDDGETLAEHGSSGGKRQVRSGIGHHFDEAAGLSAVNVELTVGTGKH